MTQRFKGFRCVAPYSPVGVRARCAEINRVTPPLDARSSPTGGANTIVCEIVE